MDLDACFSGYWRLTRVVSRVGRPGLFYHKVAFRLSAFTGEDLNSAACWVIRNHLQKITTFHSTLLFLPLSPSFMYSCSINHIWGHDFYCMGCLGRAVIENVFNFAKVCYFWKSFSYFLDQNNLLYSYFCH